MDSIGRRGECSVLTNVGKEKEKFPTHVTDINHVVGEHYQTRPTLVRHKTTLLYVLLCEAASRTRNIRVGAWYLEIYIYLDALI